MENKRIEAIKNWPKSKSVRNIQVFLSFANFYYCFVQGFSRIAALLTLILRTLLLSSGSQLVKIADEANNEVVEGENRSGGNIFLFKKSKNAKSKNLTCA